MQLPMLPQPRPVDPAWKCQRDGACCTIPAEVVMTRQERFALLRAAPDTILSEWREIDEKFVALKAHPCPFYIFNECVVYDSRPYNCRRFACMRPDVKAEPVKTERDLLACVEERIGVSRAALRLARLIQRRSQKWALKHEWPQQ